MEKLVEEKGSNDHKGRTKFVEDFTKHFVDQTPSEVIKILINWDEDGIQHKSVPRRSYCDQKIYHFVLKPIKS